MNVSEAGLRNIVVNPVKPSYPVASVRAGTSGVAVAQIVFGTNGQPEQVNVTQAPDEAIAQALQHTLMTWTIKPSQVDGSSQASRIQGTLTFYFQISNGQGHVLNPSEMRRIVRPAGERRPSGGEDRRNSATRATAGRSSHGASFKQIGEEDLKRLSSAVPVVLDVRDRASFRRSHRNGAINIPMPELPVRAPIELRTEGYVIIDCTRHILASCRNAAGVLQDTGFGWVALLVP